MVWVRKTKVMDKWLEKSVLWAQLEKPCYQSCHCGVCVCVCVYIYTHTHTYIYIYIYIYICHLFFYINVLFHKWKVMRNKPKRRIHLLLAQNSFISFIPISFEYLNGTFFKLLPNNKTHVIMLHWKLWINMY